MSENYVMKIMPFGKYKQKEIKKLPYAYKQWLIQNNVQETTSIGSSVKFCLVASGQADVYPRFSPTMEWDTAAGDAILRAAGGKITHPDLSNFNYGKSFYRNGPFIAWGNYKGRDVLK